MDFVCPLGRSLDVDGDEWIDLGSMRESTACRQLPAPMAKSEPEPELPSFETSPLKEQDEQLKPENAAIARRENARVPLNDQGVEREQAKKPAQAREGVLKSKAARSKESLMAFYLGRAKEMEVKHQQIVVVSSKQQVVTESERPVPLITKD